MTLAFRVSDGTRSIVYATDNEPYAYTLAHRNGSPLIPSEYGKQQDRRLVEFFKGAISTSARTVHNGKSTRRRWVGPFTDRYTRAIPPVDAGVKRLALFHHDPLHNDDMVDAMVEFARKRIVAQGSQIECFGAREGLEVLIPNRQPSKFPKKKNPEQWFGIFVFRRGPAELFGMQRQRERGRQTAVNVRRDRQLSLVASARRFRHDQAVKALSI